MGDMAEGFKAMSKARKDKREANTIASLNLVHQKFSNFDLKNRSAHVVIYSRGETIDFWPSTGLWIVRSTKNRQRGVFNLIRNYGDKDGNDNNTD